eukprot:TRINITY_DN82002_c0_g1_i1.p1 TRINITY_DN82002_c0_g1~~TRINITY_DN82002_c0_g1_i1.p1  ORF type:complete len:115 (-),score=2.37 TRINITY_DN82002_c0_g1_i1:261-605(-)
MLCLENFKCSHIHVRNSIIEILKCQSTSINHLKFLNLGHSRNNFSHFTIAGFYFFKFPLSNKRIKETCSNKHLKFLNTTNSTHKIALIKQTPRAFSVPFMIISIQTFFYGYRSN